MSEEKGARIEFKLGKDAENGERTDHKLEDMGVEDVGRLLDEVATKIPKLIEGLHKSYYSPENASNAGKAIGAFYKELIEAGMSQDVALRLTENYMVSVKDFANFAK